MTAEEKFRQSNLQGALEDLQAQIRKEPQNSRHRIFYFQLLSLLGQWQRARNQLDVIESLDSQTWPMVRTYQAALLCEELRAKVFAGQSSPVILGEPPQWMAGLMEALHLTARERFEQAAELRNQAFASAPAVSGTIDDQPFEWIADADARLGPVLEIILNGQYYWAPFEQIRVIRISPPQDLRDMVWLPAQFVLSSGGETVGLIPARYPGSEHTADAAIQLARTTQWREVSHNVTQGLGQRMLATDREDYPLLDVRMVTIG